MLVLEEAINSGDILTEANQVIMLLYLKISHVPGISIKVGRCLELTFGLLGAIKMMIS